MWLEVVDSSTPNITPSHARGLQLVLGLLLLLLLHVELLDPASNVLLVKVPGHNDRVWVQAVRSTQIQVVRALRGKEGRKGTMVE